MKQNVVMILASGSPRRKALLEQAGLEFEVIVSDMDEVITKTFPEEVVLELSMQKCGAVTATLMKRVPNNMLNLTGIGNVTGINVVGTDVVNNTENCGILVIGADTVVSLDNKILGKPQDAKDALKMLMTLSGRSHEVYTGVSCKFIKYDSFTDKMLEMDSFSFFSETKVNMYPFDEYEALDYIATGEPMDKAGAYGIQGIGERLVESINGDYNNVVGLPLSKLMKELVVREYIVYK